MKTSNFTQVLTLIDIHRVKFALTCKKNFGASMSQIISLNEEEGKSIPGKVTNVHYDHCDCDDDGPFRGLV